MESYDVIVIGAGISGAAAAWALAATGRVLLLEAETAPGMHTSGRSAALYTPNYGNAVVRRMNAACGAFYGAPPEGFADHPLLRHRGALTLAKTGQEHLLDEAIALSTREYPVERVPASQAARMAAFMRPEFIAGAALDRSVMDMDVAAMHQGFLRGFRQRGGTLACKAPVRTVRREGSAWTVEAGAATAAAPLVVNAAGAWGDVVGALAGARPVGLVPKRRTAIVVEPPAGLDVSRMPVVEYAGQGPYMKPEAVGIMASPADETPDTPHDVQPDDLDVATLVDWVERHSFVQVRKAPRAWAGLRTFVADGCPVVGFDPEREGFFWLVGQGGYGIMLAPVLAGLTAHLVAGEPLPAWLPAGAVDPAALSPARLR